MSTGSLDGFDYVRLAALAYGEDEAARNARTIHDADVITAVYLRCHILRRDPADPLADTCPDGCYDVTLAADMLTSCHGNILMGTSATLLQGLSASVRLQLSVWSPSHYLRTLEALARVGSLAGELCVPFTYERVRADGDRGHRYFYLAHPNPRVWGGPRDVMGSLCCPLAEPPEPQTCLVKYGRQKAADLPAGDMRYVLRRKVSADYMRGQPDIPPFLGHAPRGGTPDGSAAATETSETVTLPTPPPSVLAPNVPGFKGPREPIEAPIDELVGVARRMDSVLAARGEQPHFERVLAGCVLHGPDDEPCDRLVIHGVSNLVGQVGAGKSVLARVLAVWCATNGRRMTYVTLKAADAVLWAEEVEAICEALIETVDPLRHPVCAPIVGRSSRQSYVDAICAKRRSDVTTDFEDLHLQSPCLLDAYAYRDGGSADVTSNPPCLKLLPEGRKKGVTCPLVAFCPTAIAMRAELEAPIRCTTIEAFAQTSLLGTRAFDLSLASDDIVAYDECDAQVHRANDLASVALDLDKVKMASARRVGELASTTFMGVSRDSNAMREQETLSRLNRHATALCAVLADSPFVRPLLLTGWAALGGDQEHPVAWDPREHKAPTDARYKFYPLTLIERLRATNVRSKSTGRIVHLVPDEVCAQLHELALRIGQPTPELRACYLDVGDPDPTGDFLGELDGWLGSTEVGHGDDALSYAESTGWLDCIRSLIEFTLLTIALTADVALLGDNFEIFDENVRRAIGDFAPRRASITRRLPAPAAGSQCEFDFTQTSGQYPHLTLHKERFFGPALVDNLHACAVTFEATDGPVLPSGPNVLLLSGTSYLPHSLNGAVMRPVDYVLDREDEDRSAYLRGTRFVADPAAGEDSRVSGSHRRPGHDGDPHLAAVRTVARNVLAALGTRAVEGDRPLGKSLACLSSYEDCRTLAVELAALASRGGIPLCVDYLSHRPSRGGAGGHYAIGDARPRSPQSIEDFGHDDADVLVAPYASIARGYNIVRPDGHSAVTDLFLCARPLPVPEDLRELSSRLSGYAEVVALEPPEDDADAFVDETRFRARVDAARRTFSASPGGYATMRRMAMRDMDAPGDPAWPYPDSSEHLRAWRFLDVVAGLFAVMTQVWGRSARFAHTAGPRPSPTVWFEDFAFIDASGGMSTLGDIDLYLDRVADDAVGRALYGDFREAWRRSVDEGTIPLPTHDAEE